MTALHRAAQEVLSSEMYMTLPEHELGFGGALQRFSSVELEGSVANRIVDCVAVTEQGHRLGIEIRVTHPVDQAKLRDLKTLGLSVVEVDLRKLGKQSVDWEMLKKEVCDSSVRVKWLYSERAERMIRGAMSEWKSHLQSLIQRYNIGNFSAHHKVSALQCYKCQAPTPVFRWTDGIWDEASPPKPTPRTIMWSYSNTTST